MQLPENATIDSAQLRGLVRERNIYAAALERIAALTETALDAADAANEAMRIARNALEEAIKGRPTPAAPDEPSARR